MTRYAEGTPVSIARSREEIEHILARYKASAFMYGVQGDRASVAFEMDGQRYRMELHYPSLDSFLYMKTHVRRSSTSQKQAYEQEQRRLWRGLAMIIKAKLEAVASGISTIEDEMLAYTVLPDNETVGSWLKPQIKEVYRTGNMPPLLPRTNHRMIESGAIEGQIVNE